MKTNRESNIELLRIICMILIITHHYCFHGGFTSDENILSIISIAGRMATNCYIIITGYFMIKSKFKVKKFIKIIVETMFYSTVITIIFYTLGLIEFDWLCTIKFILPMFFNIYWFITVYLILYLFVPFINEFLTKTTKETHKKLIMISVMVFCIIPTMVVEQSSYNSYYSEFIWFIVLYIIGSYIKMYNHKLFENKKVAILVFVLSYILISIGVCIVDKSYFYRLNNLLSLTGAILKCEITI